MPKSGAWDAAVAFFFCELRSGAVKTNLPSALPSSSDGHLMFPKPLMGRTQRLTFCKGFSYLTSAPKMSLVQRGAPSQAALSCLPLKPFLGVMWVVVWKCLFLCRGSPSCCLAPNFQTGTGRWIKPFFYLGLGKKKNLLHWVCMCIGETESMKKLLEVPAWSWNNAFFWCWR